jgi:hypothetical protein
LPKGNADVAESRRNGAVLERPSLEFPCPQRTPPLAPPGVAHSQALVHPGASLEFQGCSARPSLLTLWWCCGVSVGFLVAPFCRLSVTVRDTATLRPIKEPSICPRPTPLTNARPAGSRTSRTQPRLRWDDGEFTRAPNRGLDDSEPRRGNAAD